MLLAVAAPIPEIVDVGALVSAGGAKLGAIVGVVVGVRLAFEVIRSSLWWSNLALMAEPAFMRVSREKREWDRKSKGWADEWRRDLDVARAERHYANAVREYEPPSFDSDPCFVGSHNV